MGKKTIYECDMCKQDFDSNEEFSTWTIKKPGKKRGNLYEICESCGEKAQKQLVSNNKLSQDWGFKTVIVQQQISSRRQELQELDLTDDDLFIQQKLEEEQIEPNTIYNEEDLEPIKILKNGPKTVKHQKNECIHANKSGPRLITTPEGDTKKVVRRCRDCGKNLKVPTQEQKQRFMNANTGGHDIKLSDHTSETRRR